MGVVYNYGRTLHTELDREQNTTYTNHAEEHKTEIGTTIYNTRWARVARRAVLPRFHKTRWVAGRQRKRTVRACGSVLLRVSTIFVVLTAGYPEEFEFPKQKRGNRVTVLTIVRHNVDTLSYAHLNLAERRVTSRPQHSARLSSVGRADRDGRLRQASARRDTQWRYGVDQSGALHLYGEMIQILFTLWPRQQAQGGSEGARRG